MMSQSKILENSTSEEIQAAQAVVLLRLKNALKAKGSSEYTLEHIGKIMGCSKQSVCHYITTDIEMSASSWLKAVNRWPELQDMMLEELDVAEKAAAARQRSFKLEGKEAV